MTKSNLCTTLTTFCVIEKKGNISQEQYTTAALQANLFLIGVYRLLVTERGRPALPSATNCQVQRQSPDSL